MLMSPRKTLKNRPLRAAPPVRGGRTGFMPGLVGTGLVGAGGGSGVVADGSDLSGASCSSGPRSSWWAGVAIPTALYPEARQRQISFRAALHREGRPATVPYPMT